MAQPTVEDIHLLREYILLPIVITIFERDLNEIRTSKIKIKEPYIDALNRCIDRALLDHALVKRELTKKGIKIFAQTKNKDGIMVQYECRGYRYSFLPHWYYLKGLVEMRIRYYLGEKVDITAL